jgi:nucleoside-diphosphate-sugar epimerase
MNSNATYINTSDRIRPVNSEVQRLYSDSNLLKNITGFQQQVNLEKGLMETVKWFSYKDNLKKYKADFYNV